jgi:DNA-binding NarL/FixJ family response regulator
MPLRVLLIERSALVRAGLRRILEDEADIAVVAEASYADEGVAVLTLGGVDVVVVSATMDREALRAPAITSLRLAADVRIVCVGHWNDVRDVDNALAAGASGCVEASDATDADLQTAVCRAGRGEPYLSPGLSPSVTLGESAWETASERLTAREKEVLVLVAQSKSTREIAHELNLSANTIAVHRNHIMKKIGVRKATALALFAAERGLLSHTKVTKIAKATK